MVLSLPTNQYRNLPSKIRVSLHIAFIFLPGVPLLGCAEHSTPPLSSTPLYAPDSPVCPGTLLATLPVSFIDGNLAISVGVKSKPARAILDSGSELTTIAPWAVESYGLENDQSHPITTRGISGIVTEPSTRIDHLTLGATIMGPFLAAIAPLPAPLNSTNSVIGVIGMDVLSHYAVEYDLPHNIVALFALIPCSTSPVPNGFETVPASHTSSGITLLPVTINHITISAIFDTGATASAINLAAASAVGISPSGPPPYAQAAGYGGMPIPIYSYQAQELLVGDDTVNVERLAVGNFDFPYSSDARQMLLGLDFVKTHTIITVPGGAVLYSRVAAANELTDGVGDETVSHEEAESAQSFSTSHPTSHAAPDRTRPSHHKVAVHAHHTKADHAHRQRKAPKRK